MKRLLQIALLMGIVFAAGLTQAQPAPTPLVGDFRTQAALILSDALMLNQDLSDKVVEKYQAIGEKRRQDWQNSGVDFQNMSDEERRKFFDDYRKNVASDMKKELADILSEQEINEVETLMMIRAFSPDPELRGLRLIDLKDEQREKIQPMSLSLSKKMVPSQFGFFGEQMDEAEREKAQKTFDDEKAVLMAKVSEILTEEQKGFWKEKVDAINKELEEIRERMRNFQRQ
ncbi:MAG: hypothetical protein JXR73_13705 [Candidatus Omnitrophica bacterium]|nr:hypothetical protein [Candidatus Omnitrophota bacterium]